MMATLVCMRTLAGTACMRRHPTFGVQEETARVAVTKMEKEKQTVPTTEMQNVTVSKPVTKTKEVTETVRDVEMKCAIHSTCCVFQFVLGSHAHHNRNHGNSCAMLTCAQASVRKCVAAAVHAALQSAAVLVWHRQHHSTLRVLMLAEAAVVCRKEDVEREEVVLEKETVQQPTTVMKPVQTEVPSVIEKKMVAAQLHEEMRKIMVVRPKNEMQKVKVCDSLRSTLLSWLQIANDRLPLNYLQTYGSATAVPCDVSKAMVHEEVTQRDEQHCW